MALAKSGLKWTKWIYYKLQICKFGDPICDFRPEHKVPFESFLIACKNAVNERSHFAIIPDDFCLIRQIYQTSNHQPFTQIFQRSQCVSFPKASDLCVVESARLYPGSPKWVGIVRSIDASQFYVDRIWGNQIPTQILFSINFCTLNWCHNFIL